MKKTTKKKTTTAKKAPTKKKIISKDTTLSDQEMRLKSIAKSYIQNCSPTVDANVAKDMQAMHDIYAPMRSVISDLSKENLIEWLKFRYKFLQEEVTEGFDAIDEYDREEIVDSLIDIVVVSVGTLDLLGVDFKKAWREVLASNTTKEIGIKPSRPNPLGLPDLIKPDGWKGPEHKGNTGIL